MDDLNFMQDLGLIWLPFVGSKYGDLPKEKRILVIGESHYDYNQKESRERLLNENFTRHVVQEHAIEGKNHSRIFVNFQKALLGNQSVNNSTFWNHLMFYNFVQRPMKTKKDRPTKRDYEYGWKVFFEVIEKFRPVLCIFIGTGASKFLSKGMTSSGYNFMLHKGAIKINNTFPRRAFVEGRVKSKIIFIKHSGSFFSWTKWHEYLSSVIHDEINWFQKIMRS